MQAEIAELRAAKSASLADLFKKAWEADREYRRNDLVMWRGSNWICEASVCRGITPGTDDSWALFVQRGRPGKDAAR